ncbi:MAG: hypothetical protein GPOALKHO_001347 [Sodalis sp.]|nr:MAG: hypothetical protein GPOALKHO_001347 [Sodalis sp.]
MFDGTGLVAGLRDNGFILVDGTYNSVWKHAQRTIFSAWSRMMDFPRRLPTSIPRCRW